MTNTLRTFLLGMVVLFGLGAGGARAQECCRLTTDRDVGLDCDPDPSLTRLHWDRSCLRYGFGIGTLEALTESSRRAGVTEAERLSPQRVRDVFDRAFSAWVDVTCDQGRRTDFYVEQMPGVLPVDEASFEFGVRNEMVVLARSAQEWGERGHSPNAFAVTSIWHDPNSGLIYDVDMEINLGRGHYADCQQPCVRRNAIDLGNTVTHEVGHLFGLAHTTAPDSTMYATALPGEIEKRNLLTSDEACFCSIYPPGTLPANACVGQDSCQCGPPPIYHPGGGGGCRCGVAAMPSTPSARGWALLWVGSLWLYAHTRRRGRRRVGS